MSIEPTNSKDSSILICGIGAFLVLLITCGIVALDLHGPSPTSIGMHRYIVEFVQFGGNTNRVSQRLAHLAALFICAVFILLGSKFAPLLQSLKIPNFYQRFTCILIIVFCLSSVVWWSAQPVSKVAWLCVAGVILALCQIRAKVLNNKIVSLTCIGVLVAAGLLAVVPGLLVPYDATWISPDLFVEFQENYSVVVTQGDRIALGHHIFESVKPTYGMLLQVLCALWEKQFGIFSFGESIRIIRWMDVFTVAAILFVYYWYARKRPLPVAVAFLMVLPWYHTNQISLVFPNLSPWRGLGFPIAFLALIACQRLSLKVQALCLGLTAGVCLWLNTETGLAILVGLISFLYFVNHTPGKFFAFKFWRDCALLVGGAVVFSIVFYFFIALSFGYFPSIAAYFDFLQIRQLKTSVGYFGGFKIAYAPIPVLFLCHYAYILFRACSQNSPLTRRDCFRAFAATTALVWSAYFFNRPHEWYFQPQFFFYGILLIDTVRLAQSHSWVSKTFEKRSIALLILACLIAPQIVLSYESASQTFRRLIEQVLVEKLANPEARKISGIFVERKIADEVFLKAFTVEREQDLDKVIYLTGSTLLTARLSKLYLRADFDNPYVELDMEKDTSAFVERIKHSAID
ncbi:MAG: hypothetical protein IAF58_23425, partial [Leptolyngbya sp.]|nr:hypothetical protein [Candidatus Melainabacteria bacterium]